MEKGIIVEPLSYSAIGKKADDLLIKYKVKDCLPIDIDKILDNELWINIIPLNGLFKDFEINAFTSFDQKKIFVDDYLYNNLENQFRFTLAHEYGHIALHDYIFKTAGIVDLNSYLKFIQKIDPFEYAYLEQQANCFAGHFLIPTSHLRKEFDKVLSQYKKTLADKLKGMKRKDYIDFATTGIANKLSPIFKAHHKPISIRLEKEKLIDQIP